MFVSIQSNIQNQFVVKTQIFLCVLTVKNHQNLLYFIAKSNKSKNKESKI